MTTKLELSLLAGSTGVFLGHHTQNANWQLAELACAHVQYASFGTKYEIVGEVVSCSFLHQLTEWLYSEGRRASNSRTLPAMGGGVGGRNLVHSSTWESTPPGRTQPRSRPRNVLRPAQETTSPLVTRQSRVAREDAIYEP